MRGGFSEYLICRCKDELEITIGYGNGLARMSIVVHRLNDDSMILLSGFCVPGTYYVADEIVAFKGTFERAIRSMLHRPVSFRV
jgi:hypothetical protein